MSALQRCANRMETETWKVWNSLPGGDRESAIYQIGKRWPASAFGRKSRSSERRGADIPADVTLLVQHRNAASVCLVGRLLSAMPLISVSDPSATSVALNSLPRSGRPYPYRNREGGHASVGAYTRSKEPATANWLQSFVLRRRMTAVAGLGRSRGANDIGSGVGVMG
jgi:hypothetical protein